jgi:hypothetical protein
MRLVADIEKLIRTKIELEAIEFEEDSPDIRRQGRINDGRRMYHEDTEVPPTPLKGENRDGSQGSRVPRAPRNDYTRPVQPSRDPFFDKPYEPSVGDPAAPPSWESTVRPNARSISANIKPKRKVAALFKTE